MNNNAKTFLYTKPFTLEKGGELPTLAIAYHTYGTLNDKRDNAIWVCHALTANSHVPEWWPHTVEKGCFLDPSKWFVVCANIIGSCYGTTSPLSINPDTGMPYYDQFPKITIGDLAKAHSLLADNLGLTKIHALVGSSVGGFQAIEWACREPERFSRIALIATNAKASPWAIAIDETQRMAIMADKSYGEHRPDAAMAGLAVARAIGLLTYRGPEVYNRTQQNHPDTPADTHRACSYQKYQGTKLCRRFNAYSYISILNTFDTHDVGRGRGGVASALSAIKVPVLVIGITTDLIFTTKEMRKLASMLPEASYCEIDSPFGHDGFLVEHAKLNNILNKFF